MFDRERGLVESGTRFGIADAEISDPQKLQGPWKPLETVLPVIAQRCGFAADVQAPGTTKQASERQYLAGIPDMEITTPPCGKLGDRLLSAITVN